MISVVSLTQPVYALSHNLSMPYRIIPSCIVNAMKPFELIAALMHQQGLGALPLAKKMGKEKLQPQIHRFVKGEVKEPARTTAAPLAEYFKLPIDAIYDEKVATAEAKRLGIKPLPPGLVPAPSAKAAKSVKAPFDPDVMEFARMVQKLSPTERRKLKMLYQVARDGVHPKDIKAAPRDASAPPDLFLGGDSGLGDLQNIPPAPPAKKGHK